MMFGLDLALAAQVTVAVCTALGLLYVGGRRVFRAIYHLITRTNLVFDTMLGREAIVHPDTGMELAPAQPGLGQRLATMEHAIDVLAQNSSKLEDHEHRITALENASVGVVNVTVAQSPTDTL